MAKNLTFDQVSAILPNEVLNQIRIILSAHLSLEDNMGVSVKMDNHKLEEGDLACFAIRVTRPIKKVPQVEQNLIDIGAAPIGSEVWFHRSRTKIDRAVVVATTPTKYKARSQDGKVWTIPFRVAYKEPPTKTIKQIIDLNRVPDLRP